MYKKNIKNKHYSLVVTFSLFILVMSTLVTIVLLNKNSEDNLKDKLKEIGYSKIETINPLLLESADKEIDKTNVNIELVSEIGRVYNINVIYGNGTETLAKSINAKSLYDDTKVNKILLELISCLEKYPNNIFKEIQLKDYTIEICLVSNFENDNIAVATRDSNNNFKIYISNLEKVEKIERSIHHETYHILEYYMKLEYDINELYKNWNNYNPEGFEYKEEIALLDTNYVFNLDKEGRAYFVSIYSKVSEKEDRAEVFADTMVAKNIPLYYRDNIGAIKNKMQTISNVIKKCFYSVNYGTSIYWTRYF